MSKLKRPEIKVPLLFFIISVLWIVFSDRIFLYIQQSFTLYQLTELQTIKGCFFVVVVTFLIYFMIKKSNEQIFQSQEEYKDLFYNTANPMMILDNRTNRFCEVNKSALATYGFSLDEFQKMSPEDLRQETAKSQLLLHGGMRNIYQHKTRKNESITSIEFSRPISFQNAPATLLTINDITELEKVKSNLVYRENQLNQILNSITDGLFMINKDFVIEKANKVLKSFVDDPETTIEGASLTDVFPGIKDTIFLEKYEQAMRTKVAVHFESVFRDFKRWFRASAYPFDGGLTVIFRDITQEKEETLQRNQNEQNLLALINNTADLMWSVDCNLKYFIFNEPYKKEYNRVFGEEVYVGKCALNEVQGPEHMQKWKTLYQRALHGEKFCVDMNFVIGADSYFTNIYFNPIYNANEEIIGVSCFLQDITQRKLHIKKIEQQNKQLKQIAFITSHQIRVPLANILGLSEVLNKENPLDESNVTIIEHIKTSAKELDRCIINMVQQTVDAND